MGFRNLKGDVDVILFDGSDVLRFYDPLEAWHKYGYTSYNYATSSAQADLLRFYAEESRQSHKAGVYVFDLRTITFVGKDISESSLRNWSDAIPVYSLTRAKGIAAYLFNRDYSGIDIPSYFIDLFKYHTNYDALKSSYQWSYVNPKSIINIDKGFDPYKNHTPFLRPNATEEKKELSKYQEKALKELADYCDKEKLTALFICSPIVIAEEDQKLMNSVADYIESRGYEFIDFNKFYSEIGIDFSTDYGDVNHVNYLGAIKFTDYLTDLLKKKYNLPDHRTDINYALWDKDYQKMADTRESWLKTTESAVKEHVTARKIGDSLPKITDFATWSDKIKNENFVILIRIDKMPEHRAKEHPFLNFATDYGIDTTKKAFVGGWRGTGVFVADYDSLKFEGNIGASAGQGNDRCFVSIPDKEMSIAGTNYYDARAEIQIIVYDYNYKVVLDNVLLGIGADGTVTLNR